MNAIQGQDLATVATFACPGWLFHMAPGELQTACDIESRPVQIQVLWKYSPSTILLVSTQQIKLPKIKKLLLFLHLKLFPGVQNSKFSLHLTSLYGAANEISRLEALCLSQQGKMFLEQGHFENRSYSNKKPLRNREINTCDIGAG